MTTQALAVSSPPSLGFVMLAKANRVVTGEDFRATVRRGRRLNAQHAVVYLSQRDPTLPTRFGFIVSKAVGGSVARNLVRRRLRAIGHELLPTHSTGTDIVVRALPGFADLPWSTLRSEIGDAVEKGLSRR